MADQSNWKQPVKIDILVNGHGAGECEATMFREELDRLHPDATGRYAFRFYFSDPLSMYSEQEVNVRVSHSSFYLVRNDSRLKPIEGDRDVGACRPSWPILLSTAGRTGSTAVMAVLAQHPNIVVAGGKPYEVEMGCYYAHALRTLAAAGDHTRSLRTDNITAAENRFGIGFNPYLEFAFSTGFRNPEAFERFLTRRLPKRLSSAFSAIILDYYEEVAADKGVEHPIYFAEKSLPERDSRLGIRFMFPGTREILLIRDLRDVVCSAISSNGTSFDQTLQDTAAAAEKIADIKSEGRRDVLVMRYEDFVLEHEKTVANLFQFLGLAAQSLNRQGMSELFTKHGTSVSPGASIGRWKTDLTLDQQRKCEVLAPVLDRLGY